MPTLEFYQQQYNKLHQKIKSLYEDRDKLPPLDRGKYDVEINHQESLLRDYEEKINQLTNKGTRIYNESLAEQEKIHQDAETKRIAQEYAEKLAKERAYFIRPVPFNIFKFIGCIAGGQTLVLLLLVFLARVDSEGSSEPNAITDIRKVINDTKNKPKTKETLSLVKCIKIEGGEFNLGASSQDKKNDKYAYAVTLSTFYMSETEVTQELYQSVMDTNPSYTKFEQYPVEEVTWYDAVEFCNKLSEKENKISCYTIDKTQQDPNNHNHKDTKKWIVNCNWEANGYRLPTEAEWEYAAKGGLKQSKFIYSGSNILDSVAWYEGNSDGKTHPIHQKSTNELGLCDMSGNVSEWCWDWFGAYNRSEKTNPKGANLGKERVLRGGSWHLHNHEEDNHHNHFYLNFRHQAAPITQFNRIGIRLVRIQN